MTREQELEATLCEIACICGWSNEERHSNASDRERGTTTWRVVDVISDTIGFEVIHQYVAAKRSGEVAR